MKAVANPFLRALEPHPAAAEEEKEPEQVAGDPQETVMPLLLATQRDARKRLFELQGDVCIDISGSTEGPILANEKASATRLHGELRFRQIIGWDSDARRNPTIEALQSRGQCTRPSSFAPMVGGADYLVVYTDGRIEASYMREFKLAIAQALPDVPIICVFATRSVDTTVLGLQAVIDMSIPEACLSLSNNVLLVVCADKGVHKAFMAKGCFSEAFPCLELRNDLLLSAMPDLDLTQLARVIPPAPLPPHQLYLNSELGVLDLEVLYARAASPDSVPTAVLEALCNRLLLPRLDLDKMHALLTAIGRERTNPVLMRAQRGLAAMAASGRAGSEKHRSMVAAYLHLRATRHQDNAGTKLRQTVTTKFLSLIAAYRADQTSFVLGSNRAYRAVQFDKAELQDLGRCAQV